MGTLKEQILDLLQQRPGLTDREITDIVVGPSAPQQSVNQVCRQLGEKGRVTRTRRDDGWIGNYLSVHSPVPPQATSKAAPSDLTPTPSPSLGDFYDDPFSEDEIKHNLNAWLVSQGWRPKIVWGNARGIDINATKNGQRWIIEAKGRGSRDQMRVNYFLAVLGEILQRMSDPVAKYSIAFPDLQQFRNLWDHLPSMAKTRTGITAIFVDPEGNVVEVK